VLTALGERDATIAATEQRAGAASQAMITDESLTVSDAVQRVCGTRKLWGVRGYVGRSCRQSESSQDFNFEAV
jgi:hypothetical protein